MNIEIEQPAQPTHPADPSPGSRPVPPGDNFSLDEIERILDEMSDKKPEPISEQDE